MLFTFLLSGCQGIQKKAPAEDYIDIDPRSPWYWNYKGETLMLLGASWQDNLFNHPNGLEEHLDAIEAVGGNYLRNTMSHRNVGNVFAFSQNEDGLFDLNEFNEEYWQRLENFLEMTWQRDMIVQIEIWDPWDHYRDHQSFGGWSRNPFNPANNVNYTVEESQMPSEIDYSPVGEPTEHPFFRTVPALNNNLPVLKYQTAFVDKILSISLKYPNVLYCIHNETGEFVEFGDYWAAHLQGKVREKGVPIHITDMRRDEDVRSHTHQHIYERNDLYTFIDISQNTAFPGLGQGHYDNILYVRERIAANPRPINHVKNYGSFRHGEEESVARMGRIIFAGGASARFHRPHPIEDPAQMYEKSEFGLGMNPRAQQILKTLRMVTDELDMALTFPRNDLLNNREDNEAYLLMQPGQRYAVYFPQEGSIALDISAETGTWQKQWINLDGAKWEEPNSVEVASEILLSSPEPGHWIVLLKAIS